jgi:N-methylhydantoinase B
MGGSRATDPEIFELAYPYRLLQYELAPDTAGAGRWRGGTGAVLRWSVEASDIQCVTVGSGMLEETRAYGLLGAKPGSLPCMKIVSVDGTQRELGVNAFHAVDEGDTFELVSQGGGGFGDPLERDPDHVLRDVIDGLVSERAALADYGVAIANANGDRKVDWPATERERQRRKAPTDNYVNRENNTK